MQPGIFLGPYLIGDKYRMLDHEVCGHVLVEYQGFWYILLGEMHTLGSGAFATSMCTTRLGYGL